MVQDSRQFGMPPLHNLTATVREAVNSNSGWADTAQAVASELRRHLPPPGVLSAAQRAGNSEHYSTYLLHAEPEGNFSIVALVWLPGQTTPIHDHVTWCVFGVLQGAEHEELYALDESGQALVTTGENSNYPGDVSGFAPPGDIHRVRNISDDTTISIHIYGTDISRIESSVRRCYSLPIRSQSRP